MIKLAGAVLLFFACSGLGFWKSQQYQERIRQLRELSRIAEFLRGEILFAVSPLPEALERIGKKSSPPFDAFLSRLSGQMKEPSGKEVSDLFWELAEDTWSRTSLSQEDLENFCHAAGHLGYLDKEMRAHILEQYIREQEPVISRLEAQLPEQIKLFRSLGILGGAFFILLLI